MTLIIQKPTGAKLNLRKTWQPMDPDAAAYITAVEAADNQALEERVKIAIDNFVLGCKADGIWSAIKASCILAGARTLNGALVPLVGTAPTNFNFVSGDYNRKTGLVGNGSTKFLNSNRASNADPLSNVHAAVWHSTVGNIETTYIGSETEVNGRILLYNQAVPQFLVRLQSDNAIAPGAVYVPLAGSLSGASRNAINSVTLRASRLSALFLNSATTPLQSSSLLIFRRAGGSYTNARLAFYSIGESLDLALLDARVTTLINAIGAAIP
jgi:hypothetical protein